MPTRPSTYINWVPSGNPSYIEQPTSGQQSTGWQFRQRPPFQYENWLFYTIDQWIQYFDNFNLTISAIEASAYSSLLVTTCTTASSTTLTSVAGLTASTTGNTTSGSSTLSNIASTTGITLGMYITGTNIPAGAVVVAILDSTDIQISLAATATAAGTTFSFTSQVAIGHAVSGAAFPAGTFITNISGTTVTISQAATTSAAGTAVTFSHQFATSLTVQTQLDQLDAQLGYQSYAPAGYIAIGNANQVKTPVAISGDVTITTAGVVTIGAGAVTGTKIASNTITNTNINSAAAIAYSKLAALTSANILVGNGSNVATATAVSGDVTITNAGVVTIGAGAVTSSKIASGTIVDSNISATAAIQFSKLAALTSANILLGNGSNVATATAISGDVTITNAGVVTIGAGAVTGSKIANTTITDANISATAAIAGTKISPNFGSQTVQTTGTAAFGNTTITSQLTLANANANTTVAWNNTSNGTPNRFNFNYIFSSDSIQFSSANGTTTSVTFTQDNMTLIGLTAPLSSGASPEKLHVFGGSASAFVSRWRANSASALSFIQWQDGSGNAVGSITGTFNTSTAYNTSSDRRLKKNFKSFDGLDLIMRMAPSIFTWKATGEEDFGMAAQDLAKVLPQAVRKGGKSAKTNPWQIDYSKLGPILARAVQQLSETVDEMQDTIEALQEKILLGTT